MSDLRIGVSLESSQKASDLAGRGHVQREIAARVWLSPETVKTYVKSILNNIQVRDRTQAVVWADRTGFVAQPRGQQWDTRDRP